MFKESKYICNCIININVHSNLKQDQLSDLFSLISIYVSCVSFVSFHCHYSTLHFYHLFSFSPFSSSVSCVWTYCCVCVFYLCLPETGLSPSLSSSCAYGVCVSSSFSYVCRVHLNHCRMMMMMRRRRRMKQLIWPSVQQPCIKIHDEKLLPLSTQ